MSSRLVRRARGCLLGAAAGLFFAPTPNLFAQQSAAAGRAEAPPTQPSMLGSVRDGLRNFVTPRDANLDATDASVAKPGKRIAAEPRVAFQKAPDHVRPIPAPAPASTVIRTTTPATIQQTNGQLAQQPAAPQSEIMRQLQLKYAQDGREMPAMDPALTAPAAPQQGVVRNPAPNIHQTPQQQAASRPNWLQKINPFAARPRQAPAPMQAPQYAQPMPVQPAVAAQPTAPARPQPVAQQSQPAPQARPQYPAMQPRTVAPQSAPVANVAIAPARVNPAPQPLPVAPVQQPVPTVAATAAAPAKTAVAAPAAVTPTPTPAKIAEQPTFRIIPDAPVATAAPAPAAAAVANAEEFPDPFTEVSEQEADGSKGTPFTGLKLNQPATAAAPTTEATSPTIAPKGIAPAQSFGPVATTEPTESSATPAAAPAAEAADAEVARKAEQERIAKLKLITARTDRKGLKGFCPVSLRDGRQLTDALPEFSTMHEARLYYFSSSDAKRKFDESPDRYAPFAGGSDVILLHEQQTEVEGSLDHAVWYQDRLFLFSSKETLNSFLTRLAEHRAEEAAQPKADAATTPAAKE